MTMKIKGTEVALSAVPGAKGAESAAARASEESADKGLKAPGGLAQTSQVHLSQRVAEAKEVASLAKEAPDYRPDVVAEARADLAAGRLTADPAELASRMFADIF